MTNPFVINETSSEGNEQSKNITIKTEQDFIQKGKITQYSLSEDGKYIEVNFTNDKGQNFRFGKRYYLPKEKAEYDSEDKYNKAIQIFMNNMVNVARKIKGENFKVEGTSAKDVANKVITAVNSGMNSKEIYAFIELEDKDKGIFPNLGNYSPFGNTREDLLGKVTSKQKELLAKREAQFQASKGVTPDAENIPTMGDFNSAEANLPF
jgi:hypothetical protein